MTKPHYRRNNDDPLLTTSEAASHLGVSLHSIQLWVTDGTLPAGLTPGGHRRIRKSDVTALAERSGLRPAKQPAAGNPQLDALNAEVESLKTALKDLLTIARNIGIGGTIPAIAAANALGESL